MDVWEEVGKFAFGRLQAGHRFLSGGNKFCCWERPMAVFQDEEQDGKPMSCAETGCNEEFSSVWESELHYEHSHRYACVECGMPFPTSHLLELHATEKHGNSALAGQVYRCFLRTCDHTFSSLELRKEHCVTQHFFPPHCAYFEDSQPATPLNSMKALRHALPD